MLGATHDEFERFVPTMVAPRLLNEAVVERALQQNYPAVLRDAGIGGRVDVNLWLDVDGSVVRAEVASGSGHAALDEAALRVVDVMRLTPAVSMGRPVRVVVTLPVIFTVRRDRAICIVQRDSGSYASEHRICSRFLPLL